MSVLYQPRELGPETLPLAFPLIQARFNTLRLDDWLVRAAPYLDGGDYRAGDEAGIVGLEVAEGPLVGVFNYRTDFCPEHEKLLECGDLVALNLLKYDDVAGELMGTVRDLAISKGCQSVRLRFPDTDDPLIEPAREAGLFAGDCCAPIRNSL